MQLRRLLMPLLISLPLSSCGTGPKVTVCVSDPGAHGFDCYNEATGKSSFLPFDSSDKYVAFNPADAETLLNYCAKHSK